MTYTVRIKKYEPTDPRLGRHVRHDSRSLSYLAPESNVDNLSNIRHQRYVPTFDQGNLGSCTGNASTGCAATGILWTVPVQANLSTVDAVADEKVAVGVYSDATKLDSYDGSYPPTDTGSDGLSVAKVLQNRGWINGYTHATSLNALLTALAKQPVIVGTEWRTNMFNPNAAGAMDINGSVEGGHEYCLDELDVVNQRIWMHNSWGDSWGIKGRAYFTYAQMTTLLAADGDCTIFTPVTAPAPVPTPTPTPIPPPVDWITQAKAWTAKKHTGDNQKFSKATQAYLKTLGQ